MLVKVARWLRTAGHDAATAHPGEPDDRVLARAIVEDRILLTRDRGLLARRNGAGRVLLITGDRMHDQVRSLSRHVAVDWLSAPFSRCILCNVPVVPVGPSLAGRLPPRVRDGALPAWSCPDCDRLYWPGGHERRMRETLKTFATLSEG